VSADAALRRQYGLKKKDAAVADIELGSMRIDTSRWLMIRGTVEAARLCCSRCRCWQPGSAKAPTKRPIVEETDRVPRAAPEDLLSPDAAEETTP
jgi:hypothetical protein